jgi:hypothetical protein
LWSATARCGSGQRPGARGGRPSGVVAQGVVQDDRGKRRRPPPAGPGLGSAERHGWARRRQALVPVLPLSSRPPQPLRPRPRPRPERQRPLAQASGSSPFVPARRPSGGPCFGQTSAGDRERRPRRHSLARSDRRCMACSAPSLAQTRSAPPQRPLRVLLPGAHPAQWTRIGPVLPDRPHAAYGAWSRNHPRNVVLERAGWRAVQSR